LTQQSDNKKRTIRENKKPEIKQDHQVDKEEKQMYIHKEIDIEFFFVCLVFFHESFVYSSTSSTKTTPPNTHLVEGALVLKPAVKTNESPRLGVL